MEKAQGRQLVEVWGEMNQSQQFNTIQNLVRLESQLASIDFPGYGNLYFDRSIQSSNPSIPIDNGFCIGPSFDASWFPQNDGGTHSGPWETFSDLAVALVNRGIEHVKHSSTFTPHGPHPGSKDEHIQTLEAVLTIMPELATSTSLRRFLKPRLWHADLHLGNIFVCDTDPTNIVNIIDWQFTSIGPAFMQVQWPSFLSPPDDYKFGMVKPELPPNSSEMDEDEQAYAITERDRALLSKCYEAALAKNHLQSYLAFTRVDPALRHLLAFCGNTSKTGIIPLRDSMMQISENWSQMGLSGCCSYSPTHEDLQRHAIELSTYQDWQRLKAYTQELLQTDDDGWVPPQLDFDQVKARHAELFNLYIQREAEVSSEAEARRLWFYVENRSELEHELRSLIVMSSIKVLSWRHSL
ncbi:hypothetical protein ASPZODRAFT_70346 [Penicilliopsis zonata CBS 506.65]|uniref:Altered inheritance of mitochondria protein 9, mitochondrial n=1 Tax=Penicilliopsis zonata CBS 506.65 TaxID=1073090 RepID=A0A1L9SD58_9EURO|nr:hypothetical protein ASPZODRAFT_70346 [Penicilliopsis zonata CBS 506.65]OJJ45136.1 hypothetical protein ASPZODRAFT_70346 [Penicilliopsis zonata CBS 506.65]